MVCKQAAASMDGWMDGRMDGWTAGFTNGCMDGLLDGWMDGWILVLNKILTNTNDNTDNVNGHDDNAATTNRNNNNHTNNTHTYTNTNNTNTHNNNHTTTTTTTTATTTTTNTTTTTTTNNNTNHNNNHTHNTNNSAQEIPEPVRREERPASDAELALDVARRGVLDSGIQSPKPNRDLNIPKPRPNIPKPRLNIPKPRTIFSPFLAWSSTRAVVLALLLQRLLGTGQLRRRNRRSTLNHALRCSSQSQTIIHDTVIRQVVKSSIWENGQPWDMLIVKGHVEMNIHKQSLWDVRPSI